MNDRAAVELLRREVTPELYRRICDLRKAHSIAEDRRDLPALISTRTTDCVYELVGLGHTWNGTGMKTCNRPRIFRPWGPHR